MSDIPAKPRPLPTPVTQPFWDALREERIVVQRCNRCERRVHYPRSRCSHCLSDDLTFRPIDGAGVVYTFSVARQATTPAFADDVPQIIAIVEVAEGVRFTTTLVDVAPDDVRVGMAVTPVFAHGDDGITLLHFRPR